MFPKCTANFRFDPQTFLSTEIFTEQTKSLHDVFMAIFFGGFLEENLSFILQRTKLFGVLVPSFSHTNILRLSYVDIISLVVIAINYIIFVYFLSSTLSESFVLF